MVTSASRNARAGLLALLLVGFSGLPCPAWAQAAGGSVAAAVQALRSAAPAPASVVSSRLTGLVSFLSTAPGAPVPVTAWPTDPAAVRADAFLASYGSAFGLPDVAHARVDRVTARDALGMEHVRYRQLHAGIPVTGGELAVHLRGAAVVAVNAKILHVAEKVDVTPSIEASDALDRARAIVDKHYPYAAATLSEPRLEVFNRGLLEGRLTATRLAWFIEARGQSLWRYIWIDAHTGARLLDINQMPDALNRQVYTAHDSSVLPGTLVRSEGGPATGDVDADLAYDFAGDTYNYYLAQHGRDSFDGLGSPIISSVHYCDPTGCPLQNAFWDGTQMVYGTGFASADDVVAHELTHAVTQHSANLIYYMQSGALNESYSDIFGETVDLMNGRGNDSPDVRWLIGEDLSGGAIRNMMDPNAFGDPAKTSDARYICPTFSDNGGVHANSGVPNHAYALMVDGGAYNGLTIGGIGLIKAGKIQYRALTMYLLSASDFLDDYSALKQSCTDLIGTAGITPSDCAQVGKALDAVEMATAPVCDVNLPYCPAGTVPQDLFFDDLENPASGKWTISTITGVNHWFYPPPPPLVFPTSGQENFWGYDAPTIGDSVIAMTSSIALPAGARLQFNHAHFFEGGGISNLDGGVIEYSTNGGTSWTDAGGLISAGHSYGGTISAGFGNPLAGRQAFVQDSFDYTASQLNLASLAGQSVRFRFRMGTDSSVEDLGWFIDDIRVYTCGPGPAQLVNISTRGRVDVGDNVMIGGFVVNGTTLRRVLVRAAGPSLANFGVPGVLANPLLQIFAGPALIAQNDDWQASDPLCQTSGYACGSAAEIGGTGLAPTNALESAVLITLPPGAYTAIVSGVGGGTGVGLVEVFDVDTSPIETSHLVNISTRGRVEVGDNVMIGGFVVGGNSPKTVIVRAIGPSLAGFGVPNVLGNPFLRIFSGATAIAQNDNWQVTDPLCQTTGHTCGSAADIAAAGLAPNDSLESAIMVTLPPGAYTAIVSGVGNTTGVGLVEVFEVSP